MAAEPAILITALTKRFKRGVVANDALDLVVPKGTIFSLLGPNGAGKTTLVRQITGELKPTAGAITVHGIDAVQEPVRVKGLMGVVPQEANPFPQLTATEHLVFFGRLHGLNQRQAEEAAVEMIAALGLEEHAAKTSEELSGGLKRKLLVGTALVAKPPVIVLDEPTTGLDPHARREVWALIRSLHANGTTILITTHYLDEAEVLSDRVAVIGRGRILAEGTIDDVRALCRNRFKATFGDDSRSEQTIYGRTRDEVLSVLQKQEISEYSLARTSLEDLYLELTGEGFESDAEPIAPSVA